MPPTLDIEDYPVTARQQEILDFIFEFRNENGLSPTIRDIGRRFGITSPNGVLCHLKSLKRKGKIMYEDGVPRTIRPAGTVLMDVPLEYSGAVSRLIRQLRRKKRKAADN